MGVYHRAESERVIGDPLPAWRLAQLWRELPEHERFPFILSLEETIADELFVLTMPKEKEPVALGATSAKSLASLASVDQKGV